MANPITTNGTSPNPISTSHMSGESISTWVSRHSTSVEGAIPGGNKLVTTWKSARGDQKTETLRRSGESDADFLSRHIQEYLLDMLEDLPVP